MIMTILFPLIIFFLLAQPLKFFFSKGKIENLTYNREEIKKYRLNILYSIILLAVLLIFRLAYIRYTK